MSLPPKPLTISSTPLHTMVLGLVVGGLALLPTIMNIGSKVVKQYGRLGNLGRAGTFGVGYGGGTAIGFNLVPQFGRKSNFKRTSTFKKTFKMPYNRSYNRRYSSRYSRYPMRRRYRRYSRFPSRYARRYY